MLLDELDMKVLQENFDDETIRKLDIKNAAKIYCYLITNGVYYANDLFLGSLDLFLLTYEEFVERFERLKLELGNDFVEKLGEDSSFIEMMYQ